jgi:hypothetical protein
MEFIQQIGALAGLAAFVGLAVLALLYFTQAKDVRRLRESASFLVEGGEVEVTEAPAARAAAEPATKAQPAAKGKTKGKTAAPAEKPPSDAEAFRRAELARQAAERRERFERRRRGGPPRISRGGEGRFSSLPEPRALAVIAVGGALLIAGIVFVATGAFSGDEPAATTKGGVVPENTSVAVLNGTSEPGLAAQFSKPLSQQGYAVQTGNTSFPFETSVVMYEKVGEQAARQIARQLRLGQPEPLIQQVRPEAAGAAVVVILGEDKASGA